MNKFPCVQSKIRFALDPHHIVFVPISVVANNLYDDGLPEGKHRCDGTRSPKYIWTRQYQ